MVEDSDRFAEDVERIAELFASRVRMHTDMIRLLTGCAPATLRALVKAGTITPGPDGYCTWNDAAYVAAHVQFTPRHLAAALAASPLRDQVPENNRYERMELELPSYLRVLLHDYAGKTRGRRTVYTASDVAERILAEFFEGDIQAFPRRARRQIQAALAWPLQLEDD